MWTSSEDAALRAAVQKLKTKWKAIVNDEVYGEVLSTKTENQCKARWRALQKAPVVSEESDDNVVFTGIYNTQLD